MRKSIKTSLICGLLVALIPNLSLAQDMGAVQILRGEVAHEISGDVLEGAVVQLFQETDTLVAVTDSLGVFKFSEVPVGRANLQFDLLGFRPAQLKGVLVEAGKEAVLSIDLSPVSLDLEPIVITSDRYSADPQAAFSMITTEEIKRFPANFFDPGRFVTQFPGWINDHDGGNSNSVRGSSPAFFQWRLEGIEVVNPNHTANAGTFGDRATPGAGGVNMLSAEATSMARAYRASEANIRYSNTLSGLMDLHYRKGNTEKFEKTVRVGLIGLEAALEGPINKEKGSSFLVHYRYSFTGLLGALGVNFGGEDIRFQDLSFNVNFPTDNAGQFTLFGLGGNSSNSFTGNPAEADSTLEKDLQAIDFRSRTGIIGAKHQIRFGKAGSWNTRLGISGLETNRVANTLSNTTFFQVEARDSIAQQKLSASTYINWNDMDDDYFQVGLSFLQRTDRFSNFLDRRNGEDNPAYLQSGVLDNQLNLARAFANWTRTFGTQWECMLGFNVAYQLESEDFNPELRLYVQYQTPDGLHRLKGGYQSLSQLAPAEASMVLDPDEDPKEPQVFPLMRVESITLDYYWNLPKGVQFYAGLYHNLYYNLPESVDPTFGFSAFNQIESFRIGSFAVDDKGEGRTYGLEAALRKDLSEDWFYLVSGTLYRSFYRNAKGTEFTSRFDRKFHLTGTVGREWQKQLSEGRTRLMGVSLRPVISGGLQLAPINESASVATGVTVFDYSDGYTEQSPVYFRADFQYNITWNKPGLSQRLSLDIQNLTNRQNLAFYYFDQVQQEVVARYQLGLVPVLSYRISF